MEHYKLKMSLSILLPLGERLLLEKYELGLKHSTST